MQIQNLFVKNLFRPINGVIKVNELSDAAVWQELDEYVVTRELNQHFSKFFTAYLNAIDQSNDPAVRDRMGVWVSGFFGSGKSHFIKILSYLLENRAVGREETGEELHAEDFFETKIKDPLLLSEIKRAVSKNADVILFNIDSKADNSDGRDAILKVFMRVFNEMQNYSGDDPHIAEMERYLHKKGALEAFHRSFKEASGEDWTEARDAYRFRRDEMTRSLAAALEMSAEAAVKWFDQAEEDFTLNIEKFARRVKEYLDERGKNHRIIFVVDEVGQFIGSDTHLMLNLQTITENLGTICGGRAWVVVTSQEDIDSILGDRTSARTQDFSKIQGRFATRLSLSSSNTDEVIQARLLEKTVEARGALQRLFAEKGDILKNQLSFSKNNATLKNYKDQDDFAANYPFAPYHFQLIQKVFESIRKAGVTGLHLARGERSMLDAFQSAAKEISQREIGALIPLYHFYPAIESFLDGVIKRTIEGAATNDGLEPFDVQLLRALFLIRYVEIVKPNIDNLVTLCITQVDDDRLELKRRIEAGLQRLERETLINRNGDEYFFLTNEERDISREIKDVDISPSEESSKLAALVYDDVLKGCEKHRYQLNKKDYGFNRFCDARPYGGRMDQDLNIEIITPLGDDFQMYVPAKCIGRSAEGDGRVLVKMPDDKTLGAELRIFLQTEKYIKLKTDAAAPPSTQKILRERSDENNLRNNRLIKLLEDLLAEADYYAVGQSLPFPNPATRAKDKLAEAQNYLIKNVYTKLDYLETLQSDPQGEIKATLNSNDIDQQSLRLNVEAVNGKALSELRSFIELRVENNQRVSLDETVARFAGRPYGWPDWEIVLLVARLFVGGELKIKIEGATVEPREAVMPFTQRARWPQVTLLKRKTVGAAELEASRNLGQKLFQQIGPETEDALADFLRAALGKWKEDLSGYKRLADTNVYPGKTEIDACLKTIGELLKVGDSYEFFEAFRRRGGELEDLDEDVHQLRDFYNNQQATWEKLRGAMQGSFKANRQELEQETEARAALIRIDQILAAPAPYAMLRESESLIAIVDAANGRLIAARREHAAALVDDKIAAVKKLLEAIGADGDASNKSLMPLQQIKKRIAQEESVQAIYYEQSANAPAAYDAALEIIEEYERKQKGANLPPAKPVVVVRPAALITQSYLENADDIERFLSELRTRLEAVLRDNARIRIQ